MPGKPRINYLGALYHIICRGNNKDRILKTDTEKQAYNTLTEDYKSLPTSLALIKKCWDDSFYRGVLMTQSKAPLSIMLF